LSPKTQDHLVRSTLAQQAYEKLRQWILDGRLPAGGHVVVRPLCAELQLSPTPIRVALSALEREGLLIAEAHRGYTVAQMTPDAMREIYELREVLDGIAARRAAASPNADQLVRRLLKLTEIQRRKVASGALSSYSDHDLEFHHAIWEASGNTRLLNVAEILSSQVRLGSGTSARSPGRLPHALDEHTRITEAIAAGDQNAATALARMHVRNAAVALDSYFADASILHDSIPPSQPV
jgi:DNA-binding GntR family transcriptional regulator